MITNLVHASNDHATIAGALGFDLLTGEKFLFKAGAVILTAGAQAFKAHYAYQKMVTGDAHVMGLEAGAELTNYEFCCHHLSCADFDTTGMNVLQGSGARFVNADISNADFSGATNLPGHLVEMLERQQQRVLFREGLRQGAVP